MAVWTSRPLSTEAMAAPKYDVRSARDSGSPNNSVPLMERIWPAGIVQLFAVHPGVPIQSVVEKVFASADRLVIRISEAQSEPKAPTTRPAMLGMRTSSPDSGAQTRRPRSRHD